MNSFLILFATGFLLAVAGGVAFGAVATWIGGLYWGASLMTVCLYAWDKHRARCALRRTTEKTLHLFELLGGWPGALVSQRVIRHKNRKFTYQRTFWMIVLLHLAAWGWALRRFAAITT